jgi:hypothetical protein
VLAAAALLIAIAGTYVERQVYEASKEEARREAGRIAAMASAEYASGCPGSVAALSIQIPSSARRVSYGLEEARAYTIEFSDGTNETYTAACSFLPAVLYPGRHTLELEVLKNGECAVGIREAC